MSDDSRVQEALAAVGRIEHRLCIDGRFVDAIEAGTIPVLNPHDNTLLVEVAEARAADIDAAVAAMAAAARGRLLYRLADAIEADGDTVSRLESLDSGHPIRDTRGLDLARTVAAFRYFAGIADKLQGDVIQVEPGFLNYVVREPLGVVGQIVPWNFPLMFTSWKMGPALAAGNTVVLKPAELTPLTALRVAALAHEVGFPPCVMNVVPGYGAVAGQHLAEHRGVNKMAFTGSTNVGRAIVRASAGNVKKVQLELWGKGANVVFDDADVDAAVAGSAFAIFHNQGQACIAGSRLLLREAVADAFLERFVALAESIRLGNPLDPDTEMGPPTSAGHRDRVLNYVAVAKEAGSTILTGGGPPDDQALQQGCYVRPTVVTASPEDRVCQEEVFGPFVTVTRFPDEAAGIEMANSTVYGLGGGLWTRDLSRAHRVAAAIRSGMVWVNSYKRVNPGSPFGGVGESGYGREMGFESLREYTDVKSVWINVDAAILPFYPR